MTKKVAVLSLPYCVGRFGPIKRKLVDAEVVWIGERTLKVSFLWHPFPDIKLEQVEMVFQKDDEHIVEIVER